MNNIVKEEIIIDVNNNNEIELSYLIINEGINKVRITINMEGNASFVNLKIRVINKTYDSNINIICDGIIKDGTIDNELMED